MVTDKGFLAIWSDVEPRDETDYLHWLTREHTAERLGIPGFSGVRVFRARQPQPSRYFILYDLDEPGVVASQPYLDRLNAPTEWSQRIMPILRNFIRGGGPVVAQAGFGRGATICPIFCEVHEIAEAGRMLAKFTTLDRVVAARLLEVERSGTEIATSEKQMRKDDRSFSALLVIEMLGDEPFDAVCREVRTTIRMPAPVTLYDQVFTLDSNEITRMKAA